MAKDPAVLFYTGDFLNGCTDLTLEERGQYITLLCLQHQKGHLSEKTIRLTVGSVSVDVLSKFERDDDGLYFNERMEEEIVKRQHFLDTRYFNGKRGGRPSKPNSKPNKKPTENLPENEDENIIDIDYGFIVNLYHDLCPKMSKVIALNEKRRGYINARHTEYGLDKICEVLRKAGESDFLNGKNDRVFKADFEWLMRPENFLKVLEGRYDNRVKVEETHDERLKRLAGL